MSHSNILRPVHETSPPPLDDDDDDDVDENENEIITTIQNDELLSSTSPDVLNNSNDDWKSVDGDDDDDNNDADTAQIQDDTSIINDENIATNIQTTNEEILQEEINDNGWANFATFENKPDEILETPLAAASPQIEENTGDDWADFESNTPEPSIEQPTQTPNDEEVNQAIVEDDDFGEFSEVQVAPKLPALPVETLSTEQIESLISTCFPMESSISSIDDNSLISTDLPSFTTFKDEQKQISCLESSLSLWNVLSNLSNDPIGIKFQWRKSNSERFFHQALGVNERFRAKNIPLTPDILQPEKVKSTNSTNNELENIENENKSPTDVLRPHFDWKQSGLQNPLADNDSSSLSSNISKNEDNVFDANKTLDLDYYVPPIQSFNEDEHQIVSSPIIQTKDSPIIHQQRHSIPIKTIDLYPGSTTTLNDDAKRIIDSLPNFSFMSAKALMFPIRFNGNNNNDESPTLY